MRINCSPWQDFIGPFMSTNHQIQSVKSLSNRQILSNSKVERHHTYQKVVQLLFLNLNSAHYHYRHFSLIALFGLIHHLFGDAWVRIYLQLAKLYTHQAQDVFVDGSITPRKTPLDRSAQRYLFCLFWKQPNRPVK